ncbi:hypothetical protein GCM10027280_45430 [Micromonospora polyrhachis]|uniref:Uncharacterized protein n=1 Tax=Micromonospora polyrhachis TaxID=1282883 RepID=A0A7W7SQ89_9ACTN|nr:hypothetical protein [Micromonospora polyrhachis]MBB4958943.1 hypothetical protein [Micromonospora polyrhachis]
MTQPDPTTPPPGDPATPPTTPPADPAPSTPPADEPLGPGGTKALAAEREARKALEKQLGELAPLKQIADLLGGKPSGDGRTDLERLTERLTQHETELAAERSARYRAEVAAERGLTPQQAARLQGATREELLADADALLALFPTAPAGPRMPAPDPSQGARGTAPADLDVQIADAETRGDWQRVISLKRQKASQTSK